MRGATARVTSWSLPWLATFAISASIAYAMTAAIAGAETPVIETAIASPTCDPSDNPMLVYAVTTQRIPASACAGQVSTPPGS